MPFRCKHYFGSMTPQQSCILPWDTTSFTHVVVLEIHAEFFACFSFSTAMTLSIDLFGVEVSILQCRISDSHQVVQSQAGPGDLHAVTFIGAQHCQKTLESVGKNTKSILN